MHAPSLLSPIRAALRVAAARGTARSSTPTRNHPGFTPRRRPVTTTIHAASSSTDEKAKMAPIVVTFVTGNQNKLKEVRAILGEEHADRFTLEACKVDLPELQGEPEDIKEKVMLAAKQINGPTLVEDTSLCYNALKGLPGPYVKWFLDKLGHDGLNKMLAGYEDKTAYAQCIFAYVDGPGGEPKVFTGTTDGKIVPARGPTDFGWDPVFEPTGYDKTYAEMDKAVKNSISHRYRALDKFREFILGETAR
jgi:inosine triphosphate pyrophosphatase